MIENLFSTPIYYNNIDNLDDVQKEISSKIDDIDFNYKEDWGKIQRLSTSTFENDVLAEHELKLTKKMIIDNVINYCNSIGDDFTKYEYSIRSWFTKNYKGDYSQQHNHGSSDISGVYYFKTSGVDGDIYFSNPNRALDCSFINWNSESIWFHKPAEGKIILFPSWLEHGVQKNLTEYNRISLAFNIDIKR